jgi:hypothetical protein
MKKELCINTAPQFFVEKPISEAVQKSLDARQS